MYARMWSQLGRNLRPERRRLQKSSTYQESEMATALLSLILGGANEKHEQ
jgi:hypothetical protein